MVLGQHNEGHPRNTALAVIQLQERVRKCTRSTKHVGAVLHGDPWPDTVDVPRTSFPGKWTNSCGERVQLW